MTGDRLHIQAAGAAHKMALQQNLSCICRQWIRYYKSNQ